MADLLIKLVLLIITVQAVISQHESLKRCARAVGACMLAAETTEGPYYWNSTVRQDITEGKAGIPLSLAVTVLDIKSCSPVANALVDIWHCDGIGIYSHYFAASLGNMAGRTDNSTFFRGQQVTNTRGIATFKTIYPGWYRGRATHIHVKVHIGASLTNMGGAIYARGGHVSHTGQIYFDDNLTDAVAKISPYSTQTTRRVRNDEDGIYRGANGAGMIVPTKNLGNDFTRGMTGEITLAVDPTATPAPTGFGGPPGGGPPGGRPPGPPRPPPPRP